MAKTAPHGQTAVTYYVDVSKTDDTGDGLTAGTAFKHIQHALDILKKNLVGEVKIRVIAGDYSAEGQILVSGFTGFGGLTIVGYNGASDITSNSDAANYKIDSIWISRCKNGFVVLQGLQSTYNGSVRFGFRIDLTSYVNVLYCNDTVVANSKFAFIFTNGSKGQCLGCIASNKMIALLSLYNSQVVSTSWSTGSGNSIGLRVEGGAIMKWDANQPQGTTAESSNSGGVIR